MVHAQGRKYAFGCNKNTIYKLCNDSVIKLIIYRKVWLLIFLSDLNYGVGQDSRQL